MNFDNYIFRSHMVGKIISVPKGLTGRQSEMLENYRLRANGDGKPLTEKQKNDWHSLEHKLSESKNYKLNDTAKRELTNLVFEAKHKRRTKLDVKQFDKGLEKEKESRDLISSVLGVMLPADEERKSNDWVTGKRDIKNDKLVIDIKTSWDYESFNKHLLDKPNDIYLRQLDSYMDLWGIKDSLLCHVLVDTPTMLIDDEIRRMGWKYNILDNELNVRDEHIEAVVELVQNHIYTGEGLEKYLSHTSICEKEWFKDFVEMDKSERIHMIPHPFDPIRIEQRNECIKLARKYMNTVKPINNIISVN